LSLLLVALVFLALASPASQTSVALYPIKGAGADASLAAAATAILASSLTPSPKLQVIEEAMLKTVMERQGLNASDACDDTSCQVELGKLVKAQKLIAGDLVKFGSKYMLSLKLIDVQTGRTEFSTEDKCACSEDQIDELVAVAATKIRNHFGENLPIPELPQTAAPLAAAPAQPALGAQPTLQGAQAFLPAQAPKTFQEFHPQGTKGGPMVYVSDFKFFIDKFEVTNQDFQECVAAGACPESKNKKKLPGGFDGPQQPVAFAYQEDARTYCQWAGKRLPKEQEWLEAAQGTDGREYPWGNQEPNCSLANFGSCAAATTLVGSKPAGASPYGALDMAGNEFEWVEEKNVLRGGCWGYSATSLRLSDPADRFTFPSWGKSSYYGGFRCARDGSP